MADIIVAQRMWQRRDTAANWTSANPVLAAGEIGVELATPPNAQRIKVGDGATAWNALPYFSERPIPSAIGATFNGGGADIVANTKADIYVPSNFTITRVSLLADNAGSLVIDIWKDTFGNYPPTSADKITGPTPPTLTASSKMVDSTLSGWSRTIAAGSTLRFNVISCTGIQRASLLIEGEKT